MEEVLAAFVGALLGAGTSYIFQHRLWLRDARRQAYLDVMAALDELQDAVREYSNTLAMLADFIEDGEAEESIERLRQKCAERWEIARSREVAVQRAETAVKLVGPFLPWATATMVRHSNFAHVDHWRSSTTADMRGAVERMSEGQAAGQQYRKDLLNLAKAHLAIEQSIATRAGRVWRRVRTRSTKMTRAIRRRKA